MNEDIENPEPTRKNPYTGLKRAIVALGIVFMIWLVFGKIMPQRIFGASPSPSRHVAAELPKADETQKIATLEARIDALEARLKTYEDIASAVPSPSISDTTVDTRTAEWQAGIEEKLEQLQTNSSESQNNQAHLEALQKKFEASQGQASHRLAVLTAFGQLKDAALRGANYSAPLQALSALTQDNKPAQDVLASLSADSDKGIAQLPELQKSFSVLIPKALSADEPKSLFGNIRSLVHIRKVGEQQSGTDDESVLARAEVKLSRNDVEGCLKEMAQLSAPAASIFKEWLKQAQTTLDIRTTLDALQLALTQTPEAPEPAAPVEPVQ